MRKVALVFVIAVIAPSLVLAWLALRSLRDQEVVLERQQTLLYWGGRYCGSEDSNADRRTAQ
jgi:hypothetical protein